MLKQFYSTSSPDEMCFFSLQAVVVHKLVVCAVSLAFYMTATRILPVEYNIDEHFLETSSVPTKVIYLYLSLMAARPKYYFAWTLGELAGK